MVQNETEDCLPHLLTSYTPGASTSMPDSGRPKVGQIGPKWDKCVTFSDQISADFGLPQDFFRSEYQYIKFGSAICPI